MHSPLHNAGGWLARRAAIGGERLALVDADRELDYRALHERTSRCVAVLARTGLRRGDRVALLLGNRSAYLEVVFAAARLGAIAVPINARFTSHEIRRVFDDCTPHLLVHEASLAPVVEGACRLAGEPPRVRIACGGDPDDFEKALSEADPDPRIEPLSPDDPMILMYTSGSTGTPKGALLPHRKTLFNTLNAQIYFGLTQDDRVLVAIPLFHSFGLAILSIPTLYAGGAVWLERRFQPEAVWEAVDRHRITFFGGVPTQFQALLEVLESSPPDRFDLRSLRFLFTAGAAIPVEVVRAYRARGLLLKQGYGQTETSILCCLDSRDALRKAGTVGRPVFHADVRVAALASLDLPPEQWEQAAPGETGEIVVRGPITMLGYWRNPEASAETLRGDWLRTGDLAVADEEGFLTLVGRARQMYISGGENVYPAEIEAVYAEHPAIREIAVVGVADRKWGEVGQAFVVLNAGEELDEEALRAWGGERLARFKLPARFVAVPELPRTESGKVQRHRLLDPGDVVKGSL